MYGSMATEASSEPNHSTAHINNKNVVYYLENLNEKITPKVSKLESKLDYLTRLRPSVLGPTPPRRLRTYPT